MYHFEQILPARPAARIRSLPLSRDQVMLLLAAFNLIILGPETYLSHVLNGTILTREWIPILFGPIAGVILLIAGLIALRRRYLATVLANLVFLASIVVGFLGAYFHVVRGALPSAPLFERLTLDLLVWAPPVLAPMAFALVGVIGISAAWIESPPDSGTLLFLGGRKIHLPYSKTRAYFFMTSMGILIALVSSVLDHARTGFTAPTLWIPTLVGAFGAVTAALMGAFDRPTRFDVGVYTVAMLLMVLTGILGAGLHINANLVAGRVIVAERFLRGAPFLAPLLFSNFGMMGLIVLLDPHEEPNPRDAD